VSPRRDDLPKTLNQKDAIKFLKDHGWEQGRGGKHSVKMQKDGRPRPITLPMHNGRDYSPGLTASILREAGLR